MTKYERIYKKVFPEIKYYIGRFYDSPVTMKTVGCLLKFLDSCADCLQYEFGDREMVEAAIKSALLRVGSEIGSTYVYQVYRDFLAKRDNRKGEKT